MRFFKPKFKRQSIPMWAFPLVGLMALLVILLASQPGAAQAQAPMDPYLVYSTDATSIYMVPRLTGVMPDMSAAQLVTAAPSCSATVRPGLLTLSDGQGDFLAIWREDGANCHSRFIPNNSGSFTEVDLGAWPSDWGASHPAADVNNDGLSDLLLVRRVTSGYSDYEYKMAFGQADGSFDFNSSSPTTIVQSQWGARFSLGDLDADGNVDVTYFSYASGGSFTTQIYMLAGYGDGTFDTVANKQSVLTAPSGVSSNQMVYGDFNEDGQTDVYLPPDDDTSDLGQSYMALNDGSNNFAVQEAMDFRPTVETRRPDTFWASAQSCDIDLDGHADLLVRDHEWQTDSYNYIVHAGDGNAQFDANGTVIDSGSNPGISLICSRTSTTYVEPPNMCGCEIDLVNNTHTCQDVAPISFVYGPATNQAVVKFGFDPTLYNHTAVRFDVEYGGDPTGWTVDIGDASTNNGWGGDAGLTSNAAEMQILNTTMDLYSNVLPGYQNVTTDGHLHLLGVPNVVSQGDTISLEVSDEHLGWQYPGASNQFNSPYLYTLNGQPTLYGSVDYDIYAGFNRTIGSGARNGSGATKVTISCLEETEPEVNALTCEGAEGYPGDMLLVDLIASGIKVYGLQANAAVNPAIAAPQSAAFGNFFDSPYLAGINLADAAAGTWDGAASQQNPNPAVTGSDIFATVSYQALSSGSSNVTLSALFSDRDGFELGGEVGACTITVLDYGSISGTVTYQGRLTHADIEVVATGLVTNNDLTDGNGDFDIGGLKGGDYQVKADVASYLPACAADVPVVSGQLASLPSTQLLGGDVNDDVETDLVINIGDATRLGASFNQPASADTQADINADGTINVQDLSILGGNYDVSGCQVW